MKKGIISADWHIDYNNRMDDTRARIDELVDHAIGHKVDFFAFNGDAYKNCRPMPVEQEIFQSAQIRLVNAGIQVIDIVGNHDYPNSENQIHCLSEWKTLGIKGVTVVDEPSVISLGSDDEGHYVALCMPHIPKSVTGKRRYAEVYKEEFEKLWENYQEHVRHVSTGRPFYVMFLSHVLATGAVLGATDWAVAQGDGVDIAEVLRGKYIDLGFLGDVHKEQSVLVQGPTVVAYSGSLERIDFGETMDRKGFYSVELGHPSKMEFVVNNAVPFVEVVCNITTSSPMNELSAFLEQEFHNPGRYEGAIVKVVIEATEEQARLIDETKFRELFAELRPREIASFQVNVTGAERVRNENVNENASPVDTLKEWVGMQVDISEDKKERIIKTGEKILKGLN